MKNNSSSYHPIIYYFLCHIRSFMFGLGEIFRSPFSSIMTLAVIGLAVALPTFFLYLLGNLQAVSHNWDGKPSISIYLTTELTAQQTTHTIQIVQGTPNVLSVKYISPKAGLAKMAKLANLSNELQHIKHNPLPGVLVVTPSSQADNTNALKTLATTLKEIPNVSSVQLDLMWVQRLFNIVTIAKRITYTLGALFALGVILITGNTIRLIMQSHRREIEVMQLLGATASFIQRPILYQGLLYGLLGGIIAWAFVSITLWALSGPITSLGLSYSTHFAFSGLSLNAGLKIILVSAVLAWLGTYIAIYQPLKRSETI